MELTDSLWATDTALEPLLAPKGTGGGTSGGGEEAIKIHEWCLYFLLVYYSLHCRVRQAIVKYHIQSPNEAVIKRGLSLSFSFKQRVVYELNINTV